MAGKGKSEDGGTPVVFIITGGLALVLGALVYYLHTEAETTVQNLERAKAEYREMAKWQAPILQFARQRAKLPSLKESSEDILPYLDKKRTQAQIPQNLFSPQKNPENKFGGWRENSYTVTLRGTKEIPIQRPWIVDFMSLVESDRPAVKSKSMNLSYAGENFSSVSVTFSTFVRE